MRYSFIDLRRELKYIQKRYSFFWVALRSVQLDQKCGCLDQYEMPPSSCTKCMGTGHLFVDKLIKAQRTRSIPGQSLATKIGKINTSERTWVIQYRSKPKDSDIILELDLDESTGSPRQPFSIRRAFKIQSATPMRGEDGRIEYWNCTSEERNFSVGRALEVPSKTRRVTIQPETVSALDWFLRISNLSGEQKTIQLSDTFTLPVRIFAGESKVIALDPQQDPPTGELHVRTYDGVQRKATFYEE